MSRAAVCTLAAVLTLAVALCNRLQREQAGAGLDSLTHSEMVTFTQLNDDYKAKFAFPFILAVKGISVACTFVFFTF